jgi:hypothetical protein
MVATFARRSAVAVRPWTVSASRNSVRSAIAIARRKDLFMFTPFGSMPHYPWGVQRYLWITRG